MRKIKTKLVILICILTFVSIFASSCTERQKINGAIESTNNLESLNCDLYWKISIKDGYRKKETNVQEQILINNDKILVSSHEYGSDEKSVVYADGKSVYLNNGETIVLEEYNSQNVSLDNSIRGLLTTYPKQLFELARVDNINGKLKLSVGLEPVPFRAVLDTFLTGIEKKLDMEPDDNVTVEYSDCNLEIVVVDGYVSQVNVSFAIERKSEDLPREARITVSLNINNPGEEVTVNKPE